MPKNDYAHMERRQRITREQRRQTFKRWQRVVIAVFFILLVSLIAAAVRGV